MIVCATTLTTFAMLGGPDRTWLWDAWLKHAEEMKESHPDGVKFFAAIEQDARGMDDFRPLTDRLLELDGEWWSYSLNTGRTSVTQANRLKHINTGQNMMTAFATEEQATHLLHVAADCEPPSDVLPKLLEVRNGIAAAECTTYCFNSPELPQYTDFPVTGPPMTAVCVLISREVFKRLRWRYDPERGMTDDPCYTYDARSLLGVETRVRKDCVAIHHPQAIGAIETRFPGLDMSVRSGP